MAGNKKMLSGKIYIGCIIAVVIVIIAGCISLPYLTRTSAALMLEQTAEALTDKLKLPEQERAAVIEQFNTLAEKVRNQEVDLKQLEKLSKILAEGPLPTIVMARVVETTYIEASSLSEEEKQAGTVTLSRFVQGVIIGDITASEADAIEEIMFELPADSEIEGMVDSEEEETSYRDKRLKENMSDEDLAELLANMKAAADEADVPEVVANPDIPSVIQVAIDQIMLEAQTPAETN